MAQRVMKREEPARLRPNGSGRLPAAEAAMLPDRLLDAATTMLVERGYAGTSMERIAQAAGASTKTIYGRYRNKDEILRASIRRMIDRTLPNLVEGFGIDLDESDPRAFLTKLGLRIATATTSKEGLGLYRLVVAEQPRFPELGHVHEAGPDRATALIARLFERWARTGRLTLSLKSEVAATLFLDLVGATPRNVAVIGKPLSRAALQAHVTTAVDLFLDGCRVQREPMTRQTSRVVTDRQS